MYLYEMALSEVLDSSPSQLLAENLDMYLIEATELPLQEAKYLISLCEQAMHQDMSKIDEYHGKRLKRLKFWYETKKKKLRKMMTGSEKYGATGQKFAPGSGTSDVKANRVQRAIRNLEQDYKIKLHDLTKAHEKAKHAAASKWAKNKIKVKAAYHAVPKKGKVGIAAGLGAGAAYAAYKHNQ